MDKQQARKLYELTDRLSKLDTNSLSEEQKQQRDSMIAKLQEEVKQRLDPKCWSGYKKQGTKIKGDTRVNNCVPESTAQGVTEGYYDLNDDGMQPIDLTANPGLRDLMNRHSQLYYQGMEGSTTDEEMAEQDAIEQYALEKFGQKGLDSLNSSTQTNFWGRKDGRGSGGYRGDNLGRASAPGGSFRTTKSGVMHKQDTKMMKNKVAGRLGRHPEPNLPESVAEGSDPNKQSHAEAFKSETDTMKPDTKKYVGRKGGKEVHAKKDAQGNVKFYHRDGIKGPLKAVTEGVDEGYTVTRGIDKERYTERPGLEGPFSTRSGKVVYYDPQEGKYYDPETDFYIDHNDYAKMDESSAEYNDEAGMAESNLHTMARAVAGLIKTIEADDNLPEWAQEKIAKAEMMVTSVWDYLLSQKEQGMDPKVQESKKSSPKLTAVSIREPDSVSEEINNEAYKRLHRVFDFSNYKG